MTRKKNSKKKNINIDVLEGNSILSQLTANINKPSYESNPTEINDLLVIENIKTRVLNDTDEQFIATIVNRNMVQTESKITISKGDDSPMAQMMANSSQYRLSFQFDDRRGNIFGYSVTWDDFDLFWVREGDFFRREKEKVSLDDIANEIWVDWLEKVGIIV